MVSFKIIPIEGDILFMPDFEQLLGCDNKMSTQHIFILVLISNKMINCHESQTLLQGEADSFCGGTEMAQSEAPLSLIHTHIMHIMT